MKSNDTIENNNLNWTWFLIVEISFLYKKKRPHYTTYDSWKTICLQSLSDDPDDDLVFPEMAVTKLAHTDFIMIIKSYLWFHSFGGPLFIFSL